VRVPVRVSPGVRERDRAPFAERDLHERLPDQRLLDADDAAANPPWLDAITRDPLFFYVTVDAVDFCSRDFPNSSGYWYQHATPDEDNTLIGDIIYINYKTNQSDSIPRPSTSSTTATTRAILGRGSTASCTATT